MENSNSLRGEKGSYPVFLLVLQFPSADILPECNVSVWSHSKDVCGHVSYSYVHEEEQQFLVICLANG